MDKHTAILKKAYYAMNVRDVDTALSMMHPEVCWSNGTEGGYVQGVTNVRDYWAKQWSIIDPDVEPLQFTNEGNGKITVDVRQVIRDMHENVVSDDTLKHVFLMKDGLIASMEVHKHGN
ncbi:ketosteroid isomerase [Deminuibacter soli]|uniref:Ketosteroid isomerase n=2 Tax=Deminuibacter soli TaxID=2291815 RepID=A0A3E1NQC0_9BACT|nr:ketosteroid isomerase [Deminuibacter soli]